MVKKAVANHDFMSTNFIDTINDNDNNLTFGQKMADKVAEFGGSWAFIFTFFALAGDLKKMTSQIWKVVTYVLYKRASTFR